MSSSVAQDPSSRVVTRARIGFRARVTYFELGCPETNIDPWKLCYTTLFQLIYPTRKKVKRMFTKRRKLGIGSQKSHGLGRDFLELQLLQFFFYNKWTFFLLCYIWGNCLRFLQPPLPPLSLYRWSVPKATTFLRACYPR